MRYVLKQIDDYTPSETTVEFQADNLYTILEQFEYFLKGSGYTLHGRLDIVPDSEYYGEELPSETVTVSTFDDQGDIQHSHYYFDKDRNR